MDLEDLPATWTAVVSALETSNAYAWLDQVEFAILLEHHPGDGETFAALGWRRGGLAALFVRGNRCAGVVVAGKRSKDRADLVEDFVTRFRVDDYGDPLALTDNGQGIAHF